MLMSKPSNRFFDFLNFPLATCGRILVVTDILGTSPWNLGLRDWAKSFCVVAVHPGQKMAASQHLSTSQVDTSEIFGLIWINYTQKSSNLKVKYEQFSGWSNHLCQSPLWEPPRGRWAGCCDLPSARRLHGGNFWSGNRRGFNEKGAMMK